MEGGFGRVFYSPCRIENLGDLRSLNSAEQAPLLTGWKVHLSGPCRSRFETLEVGGSRLAGT
jgi:hypothetical protein